MLNPFTCVYFIPGIAAGAVVVAVDVIVEVTAVSGAGAGFGASCFWQPANAKTVTTARTAIIAVIFFKFFHPLSSLLNNSSASVAIRMN